MNIGTRKILDRSFTALGIGSIVVMAIALLIVLVPIVSNGFGAICFTGTVEHRKCCSMSSGAAEARALRAT